MRGAGGASACARPSARSRTCSPRSCVLPARRGLTVRAWTVFLHNGALAAAHPDCAPENAYGDRYVTDLCPANPDVRAFARALAADVAGLGVATICAESLHYHPLEHGYAHERYFVPLGPRSRFLLGLCFCPHCLEAARSDGVDGEEVRRPRAPRARPRLRGRGGGAGRGARAGLARGGRGISGRARARRHLARR